MFRCYSAFRLLRTNSGSLQKNAVSIRKYNLPFKRPTMAELPVPSGSWAANYAKRNAKNNALLVVGVGVLGATVTFIVKSDVINWGRGPGFPELEQREPFIQETSATQDIQSSTVDTQTKSSPLKESSKPKSEEALHTVEVLDPVSSKENTVESNETEETESFVETEDSVGKDFVVITDDSSLDTPSSSTNEETDNNSSPDA